MLESKGKKKSLKFCVNQNYACQRVLTQKKPDLTTSKSLISGNCMKNIHPNIDFIIQTKSIKKKLHKTKDKFNSKNTNQRDKKNWFSMLHELWKVYYSR